MVMGMPLFIRWIGLGALGLLLVHALPALAQTRDAEFAEALVRARRAGLFATQTATQPEPGPTRPST